MTYKNDYFYCTII